ncbi:MAG: metallophosphoesterase [Methylobacter sp.]
MKIFLTSDIHTEVAHRKFDPRFDYECLRFDYPGCPTLSGNQEISENHSTRINPGNLNKSDEPHASKQADVIILAGDIGEWVNGLEWARNRFKHQEIVYVAGNHEYYDSDLAILDELQVKAKELDIHFLENDSAIIRNVRFLAVLYGLILIVIHPRRSIELGRR